jgi:hypothetical protein
MILAASLGPRWTVALWVHLLGLTTTHPWWVPFMGTPTTVFVDLQISLRMCLEDLKGCEPFFSKSNALSSSVRHASVFHRRQAITEYLKHTDTFDTYATLGKQITVSLLAS